MSKPGTMSKSIGTFYNWFYIKTENRIDGYLKVLSIQGNGHLCVLIFFLKIFWNCVNGFLFGHSLNGYAVYFKLLPDYIICKKMTPQPIRTCQNQNQDQNFDHTVFHLFFHVIILPFAVFFRACLKKAFCKIYRKVGRADCRNDFSNRL